MRRASNACCTCVRQVEHLCLIEVWHMGRGRNEIRQAEGPHPRTIPDAEAWYWMDRCTLPTCMLRIERSASLRTRVWPC